MDKKGEIYLITCNVNNKKYVGQAVCFVKSKNGRIKKHGTEARWKTHVWCALKGKDRCNALCGAIRKYGEHNFSVKTIYICDVSQLNYYEHKYARHYNSYCPNGYNIRQCSSKGRLSDQTKQKISEKKSGSNNHMFGKQHNEMSKKRISLGNTGKVRTDEMKQKMKEIKTKHTGLPQYIYYHQSHSVEGYRVLKHPTLKERKFISAGLSMEDKLKQAIQYVQDGTVPNNTTSYKHDDEWKDKVKITREISKTLPTYVYLTNDNKRGTHGYQVKNHPSKPNKQFVSKQISMEDKLQLAINYINS